ncbi:MAG: LysR family transcriptional regulator [Eubacterium sp.]|nr:LysR family transcriptional regulator [Eubacterium sp.]MBR6217036.1 LysR family transcriptional regulator [Eubacterium sp.]HCA21848.1 LysR family transcriptional regulator [Lachnospiraceae bacterium]
MNLLHMKHALEVAKAGSLNKASESLMIAAPNISRSIKELESDLGITIFERTQNGMKLTPEGEEFISFAKGILNQIDDLEKFYKSAATPKQKFSISVPRASYISEAFAEFSKSLTKEPTEVFYKETNSQRTIHNMLNHDYKLGIIRYAENYDKYFKTMLEEKGFQYELVTEFTYSLIMSAENPLAKKEEITFEDLTDYIEIAHADPYVPSMPISKVVKEEIPDNIARRIFIFERASQFDLLSMNPETFMWVSPVPKKLLERYNLVLRKCADNKKIYKDVLIYKDGYKLTKLDQQFITELCESRRKYI